MTSPGRRGLRRRMFWALAASALMLVAVTCVVVGLRSGQDQSLGGPLANTDPGPDRATAATAAPVTPDATASPGSDAEIGPPEPSPDVRSASRDPVAPAPVRAGAAGSGVTGAAGSVPVALRIPAIDVAVPLDELGLNPDRTVEVPVDFQRAGWFGLGPAPGQRGSAVILGHVDSYRGPAVFYRIRALHAGDRIEVDTADGRVEHFVVDTVEMYRKDQFPARQVYSSNGSAALRLVTCGGEFDTRSRSYLSNVVVYASLSGALR